VDGLGFSSFPPSAARRTFGVAEVPLLSFFSTRLGAAADPGFFFQELVFSFFSFFCGPRCGRFSAHPLVNGVSRREIARSVLFFPIAITRILWVFFFLTYVLFSLFFFCLPPCAVKYVVCGPTLLPFLRIRPRCCLLSSFPVDIAGERFFPFFSEATPRSFFPFLPAYPE